MKALAILRVSTSSQQIDDQREELIEFVKSQGYDEIIPIEAVGASAIKMDDKYMELVKKVKEAILSDSSIKAACVWELSRLGRNDVILMEFKEFFISHHIQFICKNPYMKLLEEDGSVNAGMELAFSLFATMSKQEMLEKKSRFLRAKKSMAQKGLYLGGNVRPFGYKIDGRNFIEDEVEGKIVRLIFQLYSTGEYSTPSLSLELSQRGYSVDDRKVARILQSKAFTGEPTGKLGVHYPPIISKELYETCEKIRKANKLNMKRGERLCLGAKLVRCYKCGAICTSNSRHFVCCRATHHHDCDNNYSIRQYVVDDLLWRVASASHIAYLQELNENKAEEYRKELDIVQEKISAGEEKMLGFERKKGRIVENYEDGLIDRKTRDERLSKVRDEVRVHQDYLNRLYEKSEGIMGLLSEDNPDSVEAFEAALDTLDAESKYSIIHKHIQSLTAKPISYGKRDPRTHRPNAVDIQITTILGSIKKFMYFPKYYQGFNLYVWNGRKWVGDSVTPIQHSSK